MNSEELLLHHARTYLRLSEEFGPDAQCVREQYSKLRDLLIVEIYFMSSVRSILSAEEMSGFVLYVEGSLRTMIDSFDPKRESVMPFLKHNMENRALSYLAYERRTKCFSSHFISTLIRDATSRLQYICWTNPTRQRHLFIFLCTLLPYVTSEIVDNFCRVLNIDRAQTTAIADYLCGLTDGPNLKRSGVDYMNDAHHRAQVPSQVHPLAGEDKEQAQIPEQAPGKHKQQHQPQEDEHPASDDSGDPRC